MQEGAAGEWEEQVLLSAPEDSSLDKQSSFEQLEAVVIDPDPNEKRDTPLWAWFLLVAAVFAVSSAGVVFTMIVEVPPLTLAAWRLQLTSVLLGIGAAVQLGRMPPADRRRTADSAGLLAPSGVCLCFHFGSWVYSVEATSLTHSLLLVSASPLFLAGGAWLLRQPISGGELGGTAVGLVGTVVLATAAARSDAQVTVRGDMSALAASVFFIGYLLVGQHLRRWMPIFVYAFFVTGLAALLLTLGGLALEGASLGACGAHGVFGWACSRHYLPKVLYLGVVPGIVGHTGFNTLLRYLSPLVISLCCNLEPLFGSLLGWAVGVVAPPSAWTYVGGGLVMASTAVVCVASHRREKEAAAAKAMAEKGVVRQRRGSTAAGEDGAEGGEGQELVRQPVAAAVTAGAEGIGGVGGVADSGRLGSDDSWARGEGRSGGWGGTPWPQQRADHGAEALAHRHHHHPAPLPADAADDLA